MNICNVTSNNFNLDCNGKDMQIEVYEQLIEQLQQENQKYKEVIDKAIKYIKERFYFNEETGEYALLHTFDKCNIKELLDILKVE